MLSETVFGDCRVMPML